MRYAIWISSFTFAAAAVAGFTHSSPVHAESHASHASALSATGAEFKANKLRRSASRSRMSPHYSAITLSAFETIKPAHASLDPAAAESATHSQVMVNKPDETLDSASPVIDESGDRSLLNIRAVNQSLLTPDEPALLKNDGTASERLALAGPADRDALGHEAVSVIDRDIKRPGNKTLESGMLRVKFKDKGMRAGLQIPLESSRW